MSDSIEATGKASATHMSIHSRASTSSELSPSQVVRERRKLTKKKLSRSTARKRLGGGADPEPPAADEEVEVHEEQHDAGVDNNVVASPRMSGECPVECARQPLPSTGDARVDEMLDCALRNLEEAGKGLASLGENLEHELKLFLIELMGRTRKWTTHVESKIEWTRRDILELHKELSSRINALEESRRESSELKAKLVDSETAKTVMKKSLQETLTNGRADAAAADPTASVHGTAVPSQVRSAQLGGSCGPNATASCTQSQLELMRDNEPGDLAAFRAEDERLRSCCAELESEIIELRKENERIVKERAEYENAIQRALLKGVSSLNVEALKVLRCTPVPACCPPSTTIEPCGTEKPSQRECPSRTPSSSSNNAPCPGRARSSRDEHKRRSCPSAGKKPRKSRGCDNNMLLLLNSKDAENFGIQSGPCENYSKKSTACSGGPCGSNKYGRSSHNIC